MELCEYYFNSHSRFYEYFRVVVCASVSDTFFINFNQLASYENTVASMLAFIRVVFVDLFCFKSLIVMFVPW